ncbi:MAG TPA: tetratricopeptide repeat protein [Bacteroidota bacterium]|nr:tetratricopeptide repeat protein [Bacteroidota bacterium]
MLRPKKKISKRELKQDTLVTSYIKVTSFYEAHKRNISITVTALALAILCVVIYFKNRADNNEKAIAALGGIFEVYDAGQYQTAVDGVPERNIKGLRSIVDDFGNSPTGDIARFYLADAYYHLGRYDEALKEFNDCSFSSELLSVSRLSGIGACLEAKGEYKSAAESFEKAATAYVQDTNAPENLNNAARDYGQAGEKDKAIELYKRLKKSYPTSSFAREADRYISQLSV